MSNILHNATVDTLLERRSIRKFKPKPLSDDIVETLETVAQHAASSQFLNDWSAIRITDPAAKKRLAEIGGQPYIATAPLLYVFVLDEHRNAAIAASKGVETASDEFTLNGSYRYTQAQNDAVLALHAMETAAYSLGLGCVILGSLLNDVPALIDLLNLPEYTYPVLGLAIGKPDQDPALKPRMPRSMQFFENEYPSNNETLLAGLQDFDEEVHRYYDLRNTERPVDVQRSDRVECGRFRCDQQGRGSKRQAPRLPPRALTELLTTWFVAFFAGMRFNLLIEGHVRVAGLWIAMCEMPGSAEFAPIHP
jgi:FMN reductase (NADPH)